MRRVALLAAAALASACTAMTAAPPSAPGAPPAASAGEPLLDAAVAAARADLASRAGVALDAIRLVSARRVTWSDGSLGCPQPGMAYTQALVPGLLVVLQASGRAWHYHGSARAGSAPRLCESPQRRPPSADGPVDR